MYHLICKSEIVRKPINFTNASTWDHLRDRDIHEIESFYIVFHNKNLQLIVIHDTIHNTEEQKLIYFLLPGIL